MKFITLVSILTFTFLAHAEESPDGKIRQGHGVARPTIENATTDLIKGCLSMPLIEAGAVAFDGIENLEFTAMPDGRTFAWANCVYKPKSK